jgi:tRNA (guanine37-N1)-methyltransferase
MDKIKAYDLLGNIAIVKFPRETKKGEKKKFAEKLIRQNRNVKTVLEKTSKVKGRLRKISTKFLAGEKTKEALYRENNCFFRFNVDKTYFSPRLSNERKEISGTIKKGENVLVMFAGAAPFSIVIAKNSKAGVVFSNEINREANKYGRLNAELNKVKNKIVFVDGDIKKAARKIKNKLDVIVMPRPQLKESFLKEAFGLSKKGTRIFYYDFCLSGEEKNIIEKIREEGKKARKKIKILKMKKAGEIAPYKFRIRIDFKIV